MCVAGSAFGYVRMIWKAATSRDLRILRCETALVRSSWQKAKSHTLTCVKCEVGMRWSEEALLCYAARNHRDLQ